MNDKPEAPEVTETVATPLSERTSRVQVHSWLIEVVAGPDLGQKLDTRDGLIRVGSDPTNDIVLSDTTVSRRHLELERTPRGLLLRDLGSRNGTLVEGRAVLQVFLEDGDKIALGKTKLQVRRQEKDAEIELSGGETFGEMVGASELMRAAFAELRRVAKLDVSLLIEGETGTGKEMAARAVHALSGRRAGPFRVIDCNRLSEKFAERELFGLLGEGEGQSPGAFEMAQGGTVLLDEVAEIPLALQPKLLRVLEAREVQRLGEGAARPLDVRIIAATHKNLDEEVRQERFRADLFFRLAVARVRLPPLRTHREDIPLLARHIMRALNTGFELSDQTMSLFQGYDWPGNVRELRNVLERAALLQETGGTHWLDFLAQSSGGAAARGGPSRNAAEMAVNLPYHEAKDRVLADFERFYFAEVMKQSSFDLKIAEQKTGLSMQSLYRLLKKNGLRLKDLRNAEGLS